MKNVLFLSVLLMFLASCSNLPSEREVDVSDVEISGWISPYIEVVDGTYKFTNDGEKGHITVKLKLVKEAEEHHFSPFKRIRMNAVGENGEIFNTGVYGFSAENLEFDKIESLLSQGKVGDTKSVSFKWEYLGQNEDLASKIFKEATTFELIDDGFEDGIDPQKFSEAEDYNLIAEEHRMNEEDATESTEETNVADSKSAKMSNKNFDELLDKYEDYMKALVKLNKKAKNGDTAAMLEYAELMQKYNALMTKLQESEGNMTPAQTLRMSRIIQKYASEIQ